MAPQVQRSAGALRCHACGAGRPLCDLCRAQTTANECNITSLEEEKLMWMLIFIFVSGSASFVEFTSEKQCNNAKDQISQAKGKLYYEDNPKVIMICVPK
jgi:hypothetical protein